MPRLRVAAAQIDTVVGDLEGNARRVLDAYDAAEAAGCDLVVFPELTITGYPPEDLLLQPAFVARAGETLEKVAARTGRCAAVDRVPGIGRRASTTRPRSARTARCTARIARSCLPNYAVFDEERYFAPPYRTAAAVRRRRRAGRRLDLRGRVDRRRARSSRRPTAAPSSS